MNVVTISSSSFARSSIGGIRTEYIQIQQKKKTRGEKTIMRERKKKNRELRLLERERGVIFAFFFLSLYLPLFS